MERDLGPGCIRFPTGRGTFVQKYTNRNVIDAYKRKTQKLKMHKNCNFFYWKEKDKTGTYGLQNEATFLLRPNNYRSW